MKGRLAWISSKTVLLKAKRDYNLTGSNWYVDAITWIGEALGIMGMINQTVNDSIELEVYNYKTKYPCATEALNFVEYKGYRVPFDKGARSNANNLKSCSAFSVVIKGPYLEFSFQEGIIKLWYSRIPTDNQGFPLILNNQKLLQALSVYILRGYLSQGNKHPTFKWGDANALWETYYPRAMNSVTFPKVAEQEAFANMWVSLVPNIRLHEVGYETGFSQGDGTYDDLGDISEFTGSTINP